MKSITDLPDQDLYPLIFRNLSIDDLFNCRLVNKQFKYFSDHTNGLNKLIIGHPPLGFHYYYWCYDNKLIDDKDIISLKCFNSIKKLSIFNLEKNLKYLKIYDSQFKFEELSNLINLEYLEFGYRLYNENERIINLKNLKFFASCGLSVKLNTPKLEKIQFNHNINLIKMANLESIKHLITTNYDNKLEIFNNLEIIELRSTNQPINENLLIIFKNLKQLKINLNYFELYYLNRRINNCLIKILNDKTKLRREIDIYLEGVKIEKMDKLNELKENENSIWQFRLNNYDLLDLDLSFIIYLYYEELEEYVNYIKNDLSSTFFDKFQYIKSVDVFSVNDVNGLNWFLNNVKQLAKLVIGPNVSLDEVFYNNLSNTIKYLNIRNKEDINYDFILKLSKLIEFDTQVDKDLFELAFTSFSNLKYLKFFRFYFKTRLIIIIKRGINFYLYDTILKDEDVKFDYDQLVQ